MTWIKRNLPSILSITGIIAIAVVLYIYRDYINRLGNFGYLGAFFISFFSSLTVILPVPGFFIIISMATIFNPVIIAIVSSTGGTLGESTGYLLGYSGRHVLGENKQYVRAENWMKRWGFWAILFFSFVPLMPADIAGITAGALRYPFWKYLIICWIGKTLKYLFLITISLWGWQQLLKLFPFM